MDPSGSSPGCGMGCECPSGAQENSDRDKGGPAESRPRSSQAPKQNLAVEFAVISVNYKGNPRDGGNLEKFQHAHVLC